MVNTIKIKGVIHFDLPNLTKKHVKQGSWKRVAMVVFSGDICNYYSWFIKKRYNLTLNEQMRPPHITFINDRESDMNGKWEEIKEKYQGKEIEVVLSVDAKTDSVDDRSSGHWWFNIPQEDIDELHDLRAELGLGRPYWGLHMALGYANEKNLVHSKYIHNLIIKYGGSYN
jgi:hypothetical protein